MRILLVAPDQPDLSWASEIENVTYGHHATVLAGKVDDARLTNASAGESYDVVHFVAHADDEGVEMGGWILPPIQVAQLARHVGAQLVFLNTCRSLFMPQFLIDQHIPAVISHTSKSGVNDRNALKIATYFYEKLSQNKGDFHKAYMAVSPHDGTFSWSSNGSYLGALEPLAHQISAMEQTIKWLFIGLGVETALLVANLAAVASISWGS